MSSEDESTTESFETYMTWKRHRLRNGWPGEGGAAPPVTAGARAVQVEPVKAAPAAVVPAREPERPVVVKSAPAAPVAAPPPAAVAVSPDPVYLAVPAFVAEPEAPKQAVAPKSVAVPVAAPVAAPIEQLKEDTSEDSDYVAAVPLPGKSESVAVPVPAVEAKGKEEDAVAARSAPASVAAAQVAESAWATGPMDAEAEAALGATPFDSKAWLAAFRQAKRDGDERRAAFLRRVAQRGTDEALRRKSFEKEGKTVKLADTTESVKHTAFYDGRSAFGSFARSHQTTAHFVKADAVDVALFMQDKKNVNPIVLVMADEETPGGRGEHGTCAQEESVYRRTTLKLSLEDPDGADRDREWKYNLPPFGGVYCPDVQVFRTSESRGYEFLPQPKKVSFVCVSSLVRPQLVPRKKSKEMGLSDEDVKITKKKIETILSIGLQNGHDAIVLSAFGCGYNQNPPRHMAQLFREVITQNFAACYRHVTFAIIDDENSRMEHNPEGNIKPFQDVFLEASTRANSKKCVLM